MKAQPMTISQKDVDLMALAATLTKFGGHCNQFIGCIIARRGRVLGTGSNREKTHPTQKKYGGPKKQYLHAEIDALIEALHNCKDLSKATLYVTRRRKVDNVISMAFPCSSCMAAIREVGIKYVVFSNWGGKIEKLKI